VPLTQEINISLEREIMKDFGVSVNFNWRKFYRQAWDLTEWPAGYQTPPTGFDPDTGDPIYGTVPADVIDNPGNYEQKGTIPAQLTFGPGDTMSAGAAANRPWYGAKPYLNDDGTWNGNYTFYSPYYTHVNRPNYHYNYWGLDFVVKKRLSNKWMLDASFTYQNQSQHFGSGSYLEPTTIWAYQDQLWWFRYGGGSGKQDANFFSHYLVKLTAMYQLPFDINISGTLTGTQGPIINETFTIQDPSLPPTGGTGYGGIPIAKYNDLSRLKSVWDVNLKLEKMFRITDSGRMYFCLDCFNLFNNHTLMRKYDYDYGNFYQTGSTAWAAGGGTWANGLYNEIMNPRLVRFGVRFQF
jgi:hypothetical protein